MVHDDFFFVFLIICSVASNFCDFDDILPTNCSDGLAL